MEWTRPARVVRPLRRGMCDEDPNVHGPGIVSLIGSLAETSSHDPRSLAVAVAELTSAVARAPMAAYELARTKARSVWPEASRPVRCALAGVFVEEEWVEPLRAELAAKTWFSALDAFHLLPALRNVEDVQRVIDWIVSDDFARVPTAAAHALESLGVHALPILVRLVESAERRKSTRTVRSLLELTECIVSPEAANYLATRLGKAQGKTIVARYFREHPELATESLAITARKASHAGVAARALVAGRAVDEVPEAPIERVPTLLAHPPWRRGSSRPKSIIVKDVVLVEVSVSGAVDRESWASRLDWVPRQAVLSSRAALAIAHAFAHKPESREAAVAWVEAFPEVAATGLLPAAVAEVSQRRAEAERLLRHLHRHHPDAVTRALVHYDDEVRAAANAFLALDPVFDCPLTPPAWPAFLRLETIPRPRLREAPGVAPAKLSEEATRHFLEMVMFDNPHWPYVGASLVRAALDPRSLDATMVTVFEQWVASASPTREPWPIFALGAFGGERAARRLAAAARAFAEGRDHSRAEAAVAALSMMTGDVALIHLDAVAKSARSPALRTRADRALRAAAERLGLSAEALEERLVPDLGLDPDGSTTLDFGARTFRVGFDDQLTPFVANAEGERLRALPKAAKTDDARLAKDAKARFEGLKKDAELVAKRQLRRLESAMVDGKTWPLASFRALLVDHPLMIHLGRRFVWQTQEGHFFRVTEERAFADATDSAIVVPGATRVTLPHPLLVSAADREQWGQIFADYELVQPFPQLGRETFVLDAAEGAATVRGLGFEVDTPRLFGLEARGWTRSSGHVSEFVRSFGARSAVLSLSPGFESRDPLAEPRQTLLEVGLMGYPFAALSPVHASELLRDLAWLRG